MSVFTKKPKPTIHEEISDYTDNIAKLMRELSTAQQRNIMNKSVSGQQEVERLYKSLEVMQIVRLRLLTKADKQMGETA